MCSSESAERESGVKTPDPRHDLRHQTEKWIVRLTARPAARGAWRAVASGALWIFVKARFTSPKVSVEAAFGARPSTTLKSTDAKSPVTH
jgi:hypothetical protein